MAIPLTIIPYSEVTLPASALSTFGSVPLSEETLTSSVAAYAEASGQVPAGTRGWNFTTTPEEISWSMSNDVDRVKLFGSNAPPVTVGAKGMRDLSLNNALIEGFTMGKVVEDKIAQLESLMSFTLDGQSGYVSIPVFNVVANKKLYGSGKDNSDGGYFVIKDIKVKETMRDLQGKATRCTVDIAFAQVPAYQVSGGRDQASAAVAGAKATGLGQDRAAAAKQALQQAQAKTGATATSSATNPQTLSNYASSFSANQGVGVAVPSSGSMAPAPVPPVSSAPVPNYNTGVTRYGGTPIPIPPDVLRNVYGINP